jgi:hypothetical protein
MGNCRLRAHRAQSPEEDKNAYNAGYNQNEFLKAHFLPLVDARLGLQQSLGPLHIPPSIGGIRRPRRSARYSSPVRHPIG